MALIRSLICWIMSCWGQFTWQLVLGRMVWSTCHRKFTALGPRGVEVDVLMMNRSISCCVYAWRGGAGGEGGGRQGEGKGEEDVGGGR